MCDMRILNMNKEDQTAALWIGSIALALSLFTCAMFVTTLYEIHQLEQNHMYMWNKQLNIDDNFSTYIKVINARTK